MVKLLLAVAASLPVLAAPGSVLATDRAEASLKAMPAPAADYATGTEVIGVVIEGDGGELWSGTLRIGPQYGNASFSMSKNEFAELCPGYSVPNSQRSSRSFQLNFNVGRRNWQQQPNLFNINLTWTRPLPACQGQGTDTLGFNRVVEIPRGRTVSIEGAGGLMVKLTRKP